MASLAAGLALVGLAAASAGAETSSGLPALGLAADDVSLIGVSSGGYMATQLAVAWPARFSGLAVLAAGPWGCAQGTLRRALGQCMSTRRGPPDLDELDARRLAYLEVERLGAPEALSRLRVFVWHGTEDQTVSPVLGEALGEQFHGWLADPETQLRREESEGVGHGWPIASHAAPLPSTELGDCRNGGDTHLLACDLDIAGEALAWLHGDLAPPLVSPLSQASDGGELRPFDQASVADARGFAETGYLFVPETCREGECGLTVALHGCGMAAEQIGMAFVRYNGLNEWAATNHRVVLYPQAEPSLPNPQGCWDWWGFAESTWQLDPLHDSRDGTQAQALMAMIDRLTAVPDSP